MRPRVFMRARWAALLSLALTGIAMLRYPGGTVLDRSTRGYSLAHNFLSDLGMTVAYDGRPNALGALCFVVALGVLVLGLGGALAGFLRRYAVTRAATRLAYAGAAVGLLVCLAFVGVALAPEDRAMALHVRATLLAFRLLPFAVLCLTLAARASGTAPRHVVATWATLCAALAAYAALLTWGPPLGTPVGLTTYVVAQKLVALAVVLTALYQCAAVRSRHDAMPTFGA